MFKFIFDVLTEQLGLPIEWYYEWFALGIIETISYELAYPKVGMLYRSGMSGIAIVKVVKHRNQEKRLNNHLRELNLK